MEGLLDLVHALRYLWHVWQLQITALDPQFLFHACGLPCQCATDQLLSMSD